MSYAVGMNPETPDGWSARLELGLEQRGGRTVLASKRQQGPLTVQRPFYPEGEVCHLYILHPPGGVVGGDGLELDIEVGTRAHALVTSPGATKFYRSAGPLAVQHQRLRVRDGGVLEWFPHEGILFLGARLQSRTRIELAGSARFVGWDIISLGRPVIGERFDAGRADLALMILRDGRPLLSERLRLSTASDLDGPSGLRGQPICATFVASGASNDDLAAARAHLRTPEGLAFAMSLVADVLVARALAGGVEAIHRIFAALWGILRPRLLGRESCAPRIWAT
jgi:urease accessory protein